MNRAVGGRKIAVSVCVHPGVGKPGFLGLAAFAVQWNGVMHCFANLGVSLGVWIGTRLITSVGCNSLLALSSSEQVFSGSPKEKIVFPIHPRTKKALKKIKDLKEKNTKSFLFIKPINYLDMLALEKNAKKILTDSGGVQKEAYWLKVPCITLRNETEWIETVENGWNIVVGTNKDRIVEEALKNKFLPFTSHFSRNMYGDGKAAERIINVLKGV